MYFKRKSKNLSPNVFKKVLLKKIVKLPIGGGLFLHTPIEAPNF